MEYIRTYTSIPVPKVYFYDSNPYNRLGGEYIIMSHVGLHLLIFENHVTHAYSKAEGIPLSSVYQSMSHKSLMALLDNLASIIIPLFAHRFSSIGSLYKDRKSVV